MVTEPGSGHCGFLADGPIIAGAVHYFRVHPGQWRDRLEKLALLGCTVVETYVAWNFHAPSPAQTDFTGWRDLGAFLDLAAELGLTAIVRPGPYICAEWEGGGLPGWLLADPRMRIRTCDRSYLAAVDGWFDVLIPYLVTRQATRGGPIIAVQVENEYGSYGDDTAYLEYMRDGLLARGIDVPLVTSDGPERDWLKAGTLDGALATVNFGSRTDEVLAMAQVELPGQPLMCMEFWNGWFDHWGGPHHTRPAADAAFELDAMLSAGMSVNFYMAHGGTNFGLWNGANHDGTRLQPTVTSYDYDSPITESGDLSPKFFAFRDVIAKHRDLPPLPPPAPRRTLPARELTRTGLASFRNHEAWWADARIVGMPPAFEEIGLERGMYLLRREVELPSCSRELVFHDLHDRAYVLVDGVVVGIAASDGPDRVELPGNPGDTVELEVLVESQGRVNFGPLLGERKGVLGGIWLGRHFLTGWQLVPMPLDQWGRRLQVSGTEAAQPPVLACFELEVAEPADAFLDTSRLGRGIVWLDDFCLGRFWSIGPQRTLYVPAPLLTRGHHEVTVLDLERGDPRLSLAEEPELGSEDD